MLLQSLLPLAALVPLSYAQAYAAPGGSSGSSTSAAASSSSSSASAVVAAASSAPAAGTHDVTVGANGAFQFSPDSITAKKGDQVVFHYMPGAHSVVESTFAAPCNPSTPGVFSGTFSPSSGVDSQVFVLTVNSTSPMWLYCGQIGHCNAGMAMVINPPSGGNTLAAYKTAAAKAKLVTPTTVTGGIVEAANAVSSGSSASSGAASSASASASAAATTTAAATGAGSKYGMDALAVLGAALLGFGIL